MSDTSETYHEPIERLSTDTMEMHRALVSLREELEAVDWYRQRADACSDESLRRILLHNMREEIEHASMLMEWLRRNDADFDENLAAYLFAKARDILEVEAQEAGTTTQAHEGDSGKPTVDVSDSARSAPAAPPRRTIGSLKEAR
jgi:ferritin-like protein